MYGAAGVAAIATVCAATSAVSSIASGFASQIDTNIAGDAAGASTDVSGTYVLNVSQDAVFTTNDCQQIEDETTCISLVAEAALPYGTLIWADNSDVAACLIPTDTASPLAQIGLLSLDDGSLYTVVSEPVAQSAGFEIYDVRASSTGVVWLESNIVKGTWRIYHAPHSVSAIGAPIMIAEGTKDQTMPELVAVDGYSLWQASEASPTNPNITAKTTLFRAPLGGGADAAEAIYESRGQFACSPSACDQGVVIAPRSDASGTYYQLTYVNAATGDVIDCLTLPSSMRPTFIGYGADGFTFSFEGIYSYGGGISNLGTYTSANGQVPTTSEAFEQILQNSQSKATAEGRTFELDKEKAERIEEAAMEAVCDMYSASEWFRFPRVPFTTTAFCNGWLLVKSTNVVAGIDIAGRRYFSIKRYNDGEDYGEFLASTGMVNRFITYANVDYKPVGGDDVRKCAVRIWTTN